MGNSNPNIKLNCKGELHLQSLKCTYIKYVVKKIERYPHKLEVKSVKYSGKIGGLKVTLQVCI